MANAMPWSVRGINQDIREQAVEAAHRSGMSVGEWLNQVLAGNLEEAPENPPKAQGRQGRRPAAASNPDETRLDELGQRLERLGRSRASTADVSQREPEPDNSRVLDLIENTVTAIERIERKQTAPVPTPRAEPTPAIPQQLTKVFETLERRLANLADAPVARQTPHAAPRTTALPDESRVLDLIENTVTAIERIERKQVEPLPEPQSEPAPAIPQQMADAIQSLERRLASMSEAPLGRDAASIAPRALTGRPTSSFSRPVRSTKSQDPGLLQAVAEIEQRRRDLDQGRSPQQAQRAREAMENNHAMAQMRQQLDTLLQRIDDMRVQAEPEASRLQGKLEQLAVRMEDWQARPSEDLALIRRDIASLSAAIETLSPQRLMVLVEDAVQTVAEKSILAHQSRLPERILVPIAEVHQDIRQILADMNNSGHFNRLTRDVDLVAKRLDEIGRQTGDTSRLDEITRETDAIKKLIGQAMRAQPLEGLVHHIEALGRKIDVLQRSPGRGDESAVLEQIQEIRDRIDRIDPKASFKALEQRLSAITAIEMRLGAIAGFGEKLDEIARDISRMAQEKQPLPQLDSIASRLERIDRVLDTASSKPIAGLDTLADKLDKLGSSLENAAKPAAPPAELLGLLERLSSRIADVEASRSDSSSLDALQDEIMRLGQRIERTGSAPAGLDGVEKAISTLMSQFDIARTDLRDAASQAAEKAARDAVRSVVRDDSTDTLAAEGLLLLKRDLGEFKSAQSDADRRTRQTLEQLNSTLQSLVGRLSSMDTVPIDHGPRHVEMPPRRELPQPVKQEDIRSALQAKPVAMAAASAPSRLAEDATGDLPLEPGQRPGTPPAQSSIQLPPGSLPAGTADPRSAFIAAARRAAQTAAAKSQEVLSEEKAEPKASRFSLLPNRARSEPKTPEDLAASGVAANQNAARPKPFMLRARKPILLGLAAVLFALIGAKVLLHKVDTESALPAAQPGIERPIGEPEGNDRPAANSSERTGSLGLPEGPNKRETRLVDSSAITQSDPVIVGSISGVGQSALPEAGRPLLFSLAQETRILGYERLRDAAVTGNQSAIFEIGARLADGRGVTRDQKLAARWFEQAAAAGHAPSQYRLASLYREGNGVNKDPAIAFQWFDRAAAQGHVLAMHNAGVLLAEGVHGAPDYAGAALWFRRAAEHGIKDSQFNVAILFARGLGVNQDLGEAYRWFALAAAQGDQDAIKKRDDVSTRLSKDQLAKEKERLKAFAPAKAVPNANEVASWDKSPAAMFPPVARTAPILPPR
ncbi:Sel1-like repeat [Rhabdaerophilaceae bacterium]